MRVLVLGAGGMLGHKLMDVLGSQCQVVGTVRQRDSAGTANETPRATVMGGVEARDFDSVLRAVAQVQPDAVVNCIGIIKQRDEAEDPFTSLTINAMFPHRLAELCRACGARLIHISTDCVFTGRKGGYTEDYTADAEDLYGRTKLLGEVTGSGCLTLRTSMIGRELRTSYGLVEWFLGQRGRRVSGYTRAIFSGLTTRTLAGMIGDVLLDHPDLSGLWHVASEPIAKHALLRLINEVFGLGIQICPDDTCVCDRSLCGDRFQKATGLRRAVLAGHDLSALSRV